MTNQEIATVIFVVYVIPGLIIAWVTLNSKKFGEEIDRCFPTTIDQILLALVTVLFWPSVLVRAVGIASKMRGRGKR